MDYQKLKVAILVLFFSGVCLVMFFPLNSQGNAASIHDCGPVPSATIDISGYPIASYDLPLLRDDDRQRRNRRYDLKYTWIKPEPHPNDWGINLVTEEPAPAPIPADSDLIVTGQMLNSTAYLTEGRRNIYSEFEVRVDEVLNRPVPQIKAGQVLIMDRRGGRVRYPNGQELVYSISGYDLPRRGSTYLLFLKTDQQSPNYRLVTGYKLTEDYVSGLDPISEDAIKGRSKAEFINTVRRKIAEISK